MRSNATILQSREISIGTHGLRRTSCRPISHNRIIAPASEMTARRESALSKPSRFPSPNLNTELRYAANETTCSAFVLTNALVGGQFFNGSES